jgi:hypothetical protein
MAKVTLLMQKAQRKEDKRIKRKNSAFPNAFSLSPLLKL